MIQTYTENVYSKEGHQYLKDICIPTFIAAVLKTNINNINQLEMPTDGQTFVKIEYLDRMEYYLNTKNNKIPLIFLFMATWMSPKVIMLNAISQEQKDN